MKDLKKLLDQYSATYEVTPDVYSELVIKPKEGQGAEIVLYGSFSNGEINNSSLTGFRIEGFIEDARDSEIDEELYFSFLKAVLEGKYEYTLEKRKMMDRLTGGSVYLNIFQDGQPILKDYRCNNQSHLKQVWKAGKLVAKSYIKK